MAIFWKLFASVSLIGLALAQDGGDSDDGGPSNALELAHAIMASVAWVVFFPLGAILIRLIQSPRAIWIHAAIQCCTAALLIASVVTGILLAKQNQNLDSYHPIIGLVLFSLVFIQITGGIIHHMLFRKHQHRTVVTYMHIWLGRVLITLGMINGGLGMLLADDSTTGEKIAYGVIAGVIWLTYIAVVTSMTWMKKQVVEPTKY